MTPVARSSLPPRPTGTASAVPDPAPRPATARDTLLRAGSSRAASTPRLSGDPLLDLLALTAQSEAAQGQAGVARSRLHRDKRAAELEKKQKELPRYYEHKYASAAKRWLMVVLSAIAAAFSAAASIFSGGATLKASVILSKVTAKLAAALAKVATVPVLGQAAKAMALVGKLISTLATKVGQLVTQVTKVVARLAGPLGKLMGQLLARAGQLFGPLGVKAGQVLKDLATLLKLGVAGLRLGQASDDAAAAASQARKQRHELLARAEQLADEQARKVMEESFERASRLARGLQEIAETRRQSHNAALNI